jgi:hypothetical protein
MNVVKIFTRYAPPEAERSFVLKDYNCTKACVDVLFQRLQHCGLESKLFLHTHVAVCRNTIILNQVYNDIVVYVTKSLIQR